jgi:hypothetical protein
VSCCHAQFVVNSFFCVCCRRRKKVQNHHALGKSPFFPKLQTKMQAMAAGTKSSDESGLDFLFVPPSCPCPFMWPCGLCGTFGKHINTTHMHTHAGMIVLRQAVRRMHNSLGPRDVGKSDGWAYGVRGIQVCMYACVCMHCVCVHVSFLYSSVYMRAQPHDAGISDDVHMVCTLLLCVCARYSHAREIYMHRYFVFTCKYICTLC